MLDPPEDCFRIRMVITLLETCGHYFGRGSSKRKLDRFLINFQRYIISKGVLPLDIEFDLQVGDTACVNYGIYKKLCSIIWNSLCFDVFFFPCPRPAFSLLSQLFAGNLTDCEILWFLFDFAFLNLSILAFSFIC